MKKVFYIPLFCATVGSCVGMYNNTTSFVSQDASLSLVAQFGSYSSLKSCAPHVPSHSCIGKGGLNRKERRAQGQRVKTPTYNELYAEKAKALSKHIDETFVYNNECSYNILAGLMHRRKVLADAKSAAPDTVINLLQDIDGYIKIDPQLIARLAEHNTYFQNLVSNLTSAYSTERMIKGSTVDAFFNDQESMFDVLSPELSEFIGKKVTAEIVSKYSDDFNQVRPVDNEEQDIFPDWDRMCLTVRTQPEIHRTALLGSECPIDENSIEISDDNNYIRAADTNGNTIIWSTVTGKQRDNVDQNDFDWTKKEVYTFNCEEYPQKVTFARNEHYHVAFDDESSEIPVLYLYVKPTLASALSRIALFNSLGNQIDLMELLNSSIVTHDLRGFTRENVKRIGLQALIKISN